jgi:hypothetical protein
VTVLKEHLASGDDRFASDERRVMHSSISVIKSEPEFTLRIDHKDRFTVAMCVLG